MIVTSGRDLWLLLLSLQVANLVFLTNLSIAKIRPRIRAVELQRTLIVDMGGIERIVVKTKKDRLIVDFDVALPAPFIFTPTHPAQAALAALIGGTMAIVFRYVAQAYGDC